jgi:hypothetical protein
MACHAKAVARGGGKGPTAPFLAPPGPSFDLAVARLHAKAVQP